MFQYQKNLVIVEADDGTQITAQERNFQRYHKIIFREFQPASLQEKGIHKVRGLSEVCMCRYEKKTIIISEN